MNSWNCDGCGKQTFLNPQVEMLFDEDKDKKKVPRMTTIKSMDFSTGQMVERQVQETRDLQPRCYIVKLNAGPVQTIQRDFCEECYKKILDPVNSLWKALESFGSK